MIKKFKYIQNSNTFINIDKIIDGSLIREDIPENDSFINPESPSFDYGKLNNTIQSEVQQWKDKGKKIMDSDFHLAPIIHKELKQSGINRRLALNFDMWNQFSVFELLDYVKWRWPMDTKGFEAHIMKNSIQKHAISRLWLWAELTYDGSSSDPYHITKNYRLGQETIQWTADIIFPKNKTLLLNLLKVMIKQEIYKNLEVREIFKFINRANTSRKFCLLTENEIYEYIDNFIND